MFRLGHHALCRRPSRLLPSFFVRRSASTMSTMSTCVPSPSTPTSGSTFTPTSTPSSTPTLTSTSTSASACAPSAMIAPTDLFSQWAVDGRDARMADGHRASVAAMLQAAAPHRPQTAHTLCDLGCGNGWVAREQALDTSVQLTHVLAIDGASEMVAKAQRLWQEDVAEGCVTEATVEFKVADLTKFTPAQRYDVVFSMEVLYYLQPTDLHSLLRRVCHEWLTPGGLLVFGVDHYTENESSHSWSALNKTHMTMWSEQEWREAVEGAGFTVLNAFRAAQGSEFESGTMAIVARALVPA
eukprot:TRINITY_DN3930_c0_g2_i1.p1 TRINITY_DN3930_c0_g2~~TRINITY_DN3930_c0_g2_i1.p1  ORF type:complete len:298 (+),score=23.05 TRINITY_DN3930_c0_g2_i1:53-946(+)